MYDKVYGITELEAFIDESVIVPVTLPVDKSQNFSDYIVSMRIYNEVSKCLKIDNIPVNGVDNVITSALVNQLPSHSIVEYKIKLISDNSVSVDKTKLRIIR